ncbi:hypothetical protein A4A49_20738 [Nicotiana attenuata]|uniref:Uncharacterized protein n=1 Tax=Nicotiana attenuata TaxID=49451 RepID=A0A1J6IBB5_NICAT|nr:hypothetical protein A4A49_20738 [Nicotiana attenuata]
MVSPFPISSLFPKTSTFETTYETENSKADHMFDKLPVKYEKLDSLTLITGSSTEIVNLEDIEAPQIWNANSVEVVESVQELCAITEDHVLDEISLVVVSSDIHDLNALVHEGNSSVTTVSTVCNDSCYANASFPTKVHTMLDDTTRSDDGEEENSRDSTMTGVFDKFPQWDTLDFLVFTSQGIVVSNASVSFDVIDFPFNGTLWFDTIPWLSSYLEEIGGANQNQISLFVLHKRNWVDTGQVCNFSGFLLSKSREIAKEQKIQRRLQGDTCFFPAYNHDQLLHIGYNHEQLLHRSQFDPIYELGHAEFPFSLLHHPPDESGLDFPFDPGSNFVFTTFYGATRNCAFWTASGTSPTKFMPSNVWNLLEIPICDIIVWTIVIFGYILDGDFSYTAEFLADMRQKGGCIFISFDLNYPFGILTVVLQLARRQLFETENVHNDALLKIVGALAETSVHYTAPVHVVSVIPLALTCGERATIFLELKKSIPNNLVEVARTRIVEFSEVLAGVNVERCVLESHASCSFTVTRRGFCDDLGKGTKTTIIKSTVEHQEGVATFVDIFFNYDAFMVAQLHMHKGTDGIFSDTYKRMLDLDAATVKLTFSLSEVDFTVHFTREYSTSLLEMNSIDEQNLFDGVYILNLNLEDKVLSEDASIVMN